MLVVNTNRSRRMLTLTASGFLSLDDVTSGAQGIHDGIAELGGDPQDHVTLYDLSAVDVASQDVVLLFRDFMANPAYASMLGRKIAFVTGSSLFTMQLRRVAKDVGQIEIFTERLSATRWLTS